MPAIEVFADIWCPFAHLGLRAVVARRNELGRSDVPLLVRAWPLELINDSPQDPEMAAQHVEELRAQCAPDAFAGFDPETFPSTTLPALALTAAAYRYTAPVGEQVSLALRDALWEEGRDISDPQVLQQIADAHRIVDSWAPEDERSVTEDWHIGQGRGVKGSPHFFSGDLDAFCPSLDIAKDDEGHLSVHPDPAALDAFLTAALA